MKCLAFASSSLFFVGSLLALLNWIVIYPVIGENYDDRLLVAVLEIVAWSLIGSSSIPEILIDLCCSDGGTRSYTHGRYGADTPSYLNLLQTAVFLAATFFQGLTEKRRWDLEYEYTFLDDQEFNRTLASILWMVSALLAVFSVGRCCGCCFRDEESESSSLLAIVSNCFYAGAAVAMILASRDNCDQCFLGFYLYIFSRVVFVIVSILYLVSDCMLVLSRKPRKEDTKNELEETL
mmetsp:Transcript_28741/g.43847  ORF Transcript_28741/g.43847 Transcript_28741/m.43847 type:complete len:236 (+) Transcript_28741:78-785(+)